jgi:hypothetical protein
VSPFLSFVRRLKPLDLLLPIGAALVAAGLQSLADREQAQRVRLAELADLAGDHLQALAAAGVDIPDEIAADEPHPLDPGVPWLTQHASAAPDDEQETPAPANRGWKLAALALGAVGILAYRNRDAILQRAGTSPFGFTMPWPPAPAETPDPLDHETGMAQPVSHPFRGNADECSMCGRPVELHHPDPDEWPEHGLNHPGSDRWTGGDRKDDDVKRGLTLASDACGCAGDECGWPNCGYTPPEDLPAEDQVLALAVHRQQCFHRPAGAHVPGE